MHFPTVAILQAVNFYNLQAGAYEPLKAVKKHAT